MSRPSGIPPGNLNGPCLAGRLCSFAHLTCARTGLCVCSSAYFEKDGQCGESFTRYKKQKSPYKINYIMIITLIILVLIILLITMSFYTDNIIWSGNLIYKLRIINVLPFYYLVPKVPLGGICLMSDECFDEFAICDTGICTCRGTYFNKFNRCGKYFYFVYKWLIYDIYISTPYLLGYPTITTSDIWNLSIA